MPSNDFHVGTTPMKSIRGVRNLTGPHTDTKTGKRFEPFVMSAKTMPQIMSTSFKTDLFFTCYTINGLEDIGWPRLRKEALSSVTDMCGEPQMHYFAFDWDCPDHSPWTDELLAQFFETFYAMADEQLTCWKWVYTSRHGARIVYQLKEPVPVVDGEKYIATMLLRFREAGLVMDEKCKDWTRLFRAPKVVRDGLSTEGEEFFFIEEQESLLDVSAMPRSSTLAVPSLKSFDIGKHGRLTDEEVFDILHNEKGNQSKFFKDAKKYLKGNPCFDALFSTEVQIAEPGERNDTVMKSLGMTIPTLIRKVSYATPEHAYALYHGPLTALPPTRDWCDWLWNAICTIWPVEIDKYNKEQETKAEKASKALSVKETMREGMKEWSEHPHLRDEDKSMEYVERHIFANYKSFFYEMNENGFYNPWAVQAKQLIPRIRDTHLDNVVDTVELSNTGKLVDVSDKVIQNRYSTPVARIEPVVQLESDGYIEGMGGRMPVLKVCMYRRNPDLEGEYNASVDEWLVNLFGEYYEVGCRWIANALAFEEGPICALSMACAPGAGKQMFVQGLAECLEHPEHATGVVLSSKSQGALMRTPFLYINEQWPASINGSIMENLKKYTDGSALHIEEKFEPITEIHNPVRVIMTANDQELLQGVLDKNLSADNREALGQRIFHMELGDAAKEWLDAKGGRSFTAADGNRWVKGQKKSDFIVAKHFLWLYENRDKAHRGSRFLVEGNLGRGSTIMNHHILRKEDTSKVASSILNVVESKASKNGKDYFFSDDYKLYLTISNVMNGLEMMDIKMSFSKVAAVIREVSGKQEPDLFHEKEWYEVDCNMLLDHARQVGIDTPMLRKFVYMQEKPKKKPEEDEKNIDTGK